MLITLHKISGVHFRLPGTNGFHVKAMNERFTAASSRCRQNLKYENFKSSFGSTKKRAGRATRLLFLIEPIESLICGVVVTVVGVVSLNMEILRRRLADYSISKNCTKKRAVHPADYVSSSNQ